MLTSLHQFKIAWENYSDLLVLKLSMKLLSQCLLLQHFCELRDIGWQEISSFNRIFNFGLLQRYAGKPTGACVGRRAQLKLQASAAAATTNFSINIYSFRGSGKGEGSIKAFEKSCFSFQKQLAIHLAISLFAGAAVPLFQVFFPSHQH